MRIRELNRSRVILRKMLKFGLAFFILFLVFSLNAFFNDKETDGAEIEIIEIQKGDSGAAVFQKLAQKKILNKTEKRLFNFWGSFKNYDKKLKIGEVKIPRGASIATIWELLKNPDKGTFRMTFLEGWNLRDIKFFLEENDIFGAKDMYEYTGKPGKHYSGNPFMLPPGLIKAQIFENAPYGATLEGYIFPDTYEFYSNASAFQIIQKMHSTLDQKIPQEWKTKVQSSGNTWHEIITVASIIENEVNGAEDMKIVSGIFWKRLKNGWPLQADSTVNYITGEKKPSISASDTKIDSPYNTYKYKELPPGPISNPSLEAIEAAIFPLETDYWFFLTSPDGKVYYGRTLEEHGENRKYL